MARLASGDFSGGGVFHEIVERHATETAKSRPAPSRKPALRAYLRRHPNISKRGLAVSVACRSTISWKTPPPLKFPLASLAMAPLRRSSRRRPQNHLGTLRRIVPQELARIEKEIGPVRFSRDTSRKARNFSRNVKEHDFVEFLTLPAYGKLPTRSRR